MKYYLIDWREEEEEEAQGSLGGVGMMGLTSGQTEVKTREPESNATMPLSLLRVLFQC